VKSPLDADAAKWTEENLHVLPIDPSEVCPPAKLEDATLLGEQIII